ncbi:MAG: hypothetical protein IJD37_01860 [Clostridia bacterium]|nr:hypothetical protein [Clostridia bacterium]
MGRNNRIKNITAIVLCFVFLAVLSFMSSGVSEKVVFLRSGGTGDGSSFENSIGDFKEAVKILAKTGGKIVICGKYTFTELINLSEKSGTSNGSKVITVTSVNGDNDYRQTNNAVLSFGDGKYSANMLLAGKFVFENLNIVTNGGNVPRYVICNGYETVFGEGIVCEKKGNAPFLSIIGISLEDKLTHSGGKLTVKSGTYYNVCSGNRDGNSVGDTFLTIDGGTFEGSVSASGYNSIGIKQEGNAALIINGGNFYGPVGCISPVSNDFDFTVNGGYFRKELSAQGKINTLNINGGNMQNIMAVNIADYIEEPPETNEDGETVETKAADAKKSSVNINQYEGNVDKLIEKIKGLGILINKNTLGGNDAETTEILITAPAEPESDSLQSENYEVQQTEELPEKENERQYYLGSRQNTVLAISAIGVVIALAIIMFAYRTVYRKK